MSVKLSVAALRTYDALKDRPGARPRRSDARDPDVIAAVSARLSELVSEYKLGVHAGVGGNYVFWSEVNARIQEGAFDDLLGRL
ncbi:MAG: hypothetical protein QM758_16435 [Armatimonas sp.]